MTKIINNNKPNHHQKNKNHKKSQAHPVKEESIDLKCHTIQQLYDFAQNFYNELKNTNKNDKWNQFITQKGTKKDKITFVAAQILKKPQSSLEHFQLLAKWTLDVNHNFALPACQALSNVYIEHVFVEKPSLKVFLDSVQDFIKNNKKDSTVTKGDLIGFYLEHHIKHFYGEMIRGLTELLTSSITHIKKTSIKILASLSRFRELRRTILSTLINKFGDSDMQVVNEVSKSLKQQFYEDIQASQTLLEESEAFLFRQHLGQKPQFFVVNFLNNINLKFFSEKSLTKLFELFFHFFNKLMETDTEQKSVSSRLFLNSIKGLNKIFAFMKTGNKQTMSAIETKVELVYKTFHKTQNTKAKVQLLLFLFQSCTHIKGSISDRFYRVLYEFLSTNQIVHCSISQMFFDLLLLSMKQDQNLNRTLAFIKRLLQLCFEAESNFIATCLILISKVILEKEPIKIMMKQKENILEEKEEIETKVNNNDEKTLPYDMNKREPLYAGAEKTNLWQLTVFKNHYHPTVRKFSEHILKNEEIPYSGSNPLLQLSLTSFVQKMSLRKQKKSDSWKLKVRRNLQRIRTSKYESILQKPLESFGQNEEFIKKYLQKRQTIHKNKKTMQPQDIEQFADQIIEKQLDRLNPKEDKFDDLSISQQDIDEEEMPEYGEELEAQGNENEFEDEQLEGENEDEDLENEEDEDLDGLEGMEQQDMDFQDEDLGDQEEDFGDEDPEGYQNEDFDSEGEDEEEESEMQGGDKEFEDVFDDIGDSPQYPQKKKKSIGKPFKKHQKTVKNNKKIAHKQMKKDFKSKNNKSFKNKRR